MPILDYLDHRPQLAGGSFIAPDASVVGRVSIGPHSSVWFGAVVRGDTDVVDIDELVNIQDGCIVHTQAPAPVRIGARSSLGHRAVVHGAAVGEDCLVGIGASVLSGARIGDGSIVAAHALVPEGMSVPPQSLVMGVPGRVVRQVTSAERERIARTATLYARLAIEYGQTLGNTPAC